MSMTEDYATVDLIIIGAGLYGIQAARTYLEIHSKRSVIIFEASQAIGGVWSSNRVYDAFWTQTPIDIAEFSDRPLGDVPAQDQYYRFFAAKHITRYLETYVDDHFYNGSSLRSRILLGARVDHVEKVNDYWLVEGENKKKYKTLSLIDASGLTYTPYIPETPGLAAFKGIVIHHKQFATSNILSNPRIKEVVVIGGAKSAADVAYAAAKAGKNVRWIIRASGSGPSAFFNVQGLGAYRNSNESFYTRLTGYLIASHFTACPWWLRWLYDTEVGRRVFAKFWQGINAKCLESANYDRPEGIERGFFNLKPDTPVFWQNDSSSVNQREDFFETIAQSVTVYRNDVLSVTENGQVNLDSGVKISADAIIFATGWSNSHEYLTPSTKAKLGLPVRVEDVEIKEQNEWEKLNEEAGEELLRRFPVLGNPPKHRTDPEPNDMTKSSTPYRLYNAMLPIADHSIVFLGHVMLGNHFRAAEVQALWAIAALDGNIELPSTGAMRVSVAQTVQWCRLRYLSKGNGGNWFYYDLIPYTDMLLRDLGLTSHLKSWRKLISPAWAVDLKNLISEYKAKYPSAHGGGQ